MSVDFLFRMSKRKDPLAAASSSGYSPSDFRAMDLRATNHDDETDDEVPTAPSRRSNAKKAKTVAEAAPAPAVAAVAAVAAAAAAAAASSFNAPPRVPMRAALPATNNPALIPHQLAANEEARHDQRQANRNGYLALQSASAAASLAAGRPAIDPILIAMYNYKGGVGKTTNLIQIATTLARRGVTTLMVDADPQCNLTSFFKPRVADEEKDDDEEDEVEEDEEAIAAAAVAEDALWGAGNPNVHIQCEGLKPDAQPHDEAQLRNDNRSEERRVGKECV